MPDLVETDFLAGGDTQVKNAPVHIGATVIHAHHDATAVIDAHYFELCPEREAFMGASIVILVKNLATRSLLAMKSGTIVARLPPNLQAYFGLLAQRVLFFRKTHVSLARCNLRIAFGTPRKEQHNTNQENKNNAHSPTLLEIVHAVVRVFENFVFLALDFGLFLFGLFGKSLVILGRKFVYVLQALLYTPTQAVQVHLRRL